MRKTFQNLAPPLVFVIVAGFSLIALAHEGPDPVAHWVLNSRTVDKNKIQARLGPSAKVDGEFKITGDAKSESAHCDGRSLGIVTEDHTTLAKDLIPKKRITISSWFSVEETKLWGGVVSLIQDNGDAEAGWVLGYNHKHFYFGLATKGSDDGNGKMTYLESKTRYEPGKLYQVVGIYDGVTMQLVVNGKLESESKTQSGPILYPESAPLVIGGYKDRNEDHRHIGRIREIAIYDRAAKPEWAAKEFKHHAELAAMPASGVAPTAFEFSVQPYLQYVTQNSITVMWETTRPGTSVVRSGETEQVKTKTSKGSDGFVHEVQITGLAPETQYFYQVTSSDDLGETITSQVFTFQTANKRDTPFAFAVISDTQGNPAVSGKLAEFAWAQRPNFLVHPGDLVSTGSNDGQWKNQFFPSMNPLISRVALFPVLGNHEQNAANYYDYMSLPKPEYYYQFQYGNAEFFMLDTNKNVGPDSEQYKWLESALSDSTAVWKIVCHHHPAYTSDENDYGNLWKSNQSTRGDLRVRKLTTLYDKYNVDIVWCGHIHSYERTWSIKNDEVVGENEGPIYLVTGGGGGGLETAGPFKPGFQNNVRRGHHYCMVAINGGTLEFKAFDLENRLFDYFKLSKNLLNQSQPKTK